MYSFANLHKFPTKVHSEPNYYSVRLLHGSAARLIARRIVSETCTRLEFRAQRELACVRLSGMLRQLSSLLLAIHSFHRLPALVVRATYARHAPYTFSSFRVSGVCRNHSMTGVRESGSPWSRRSIKYEILQKRSILLGIKNSFFIQQILWQKACIIVLLEILTHRSIINQ